MTFATKNNHYEKMKITYLLSAAMVLIIIDEILDRLNGFDRREFIIDMVVEFPTFIILLYTVYYIWNRLLDERSNSIKLETDLKTTKAGAHELELKSQEFPEYFKNSMKQQFEQWNLSKSEAEIAILLLLGKSTKDIASSRFTSDRTIRNQCQSIYLKSGCQGRSDFSGFFLKKVLPG